MQYISQLNLCALLLPVNLTVNVRRFYISVHLEANRVNLGDECWSVRIIELKNYRTIRLNNCSVSKLYLLMFKLYVQ